MSSCVRIHDARYRYGVPDIERSDPSFGDPARDEISGERIGNQCVGAEDRGPRDLGSGIVSDRWGTGFRDEAGRIVAFRHNFVPSKVFQ